MSSLRFPRAIKSNGLPAKFNDLSRAPSACCIRHRSQPAAAFARFQRAIRGSLHAGSSANARDDYDTNPFHGCVTGLLKKKKNGTEKDSVDDSHGDP